MEMKVWSGTAWCSWFHVSMVLGECSLLPLFKKKQHFYYCFFKHCGISITVPIDISFFFLIGQYLVIKITTLMKSITRQISLNDCRHSCLR